jgi:hypothetical protein
MLRPADRIVRRYKDSSLGRSRRRWCNRGKKNTCLRPAKRDHMCRYPSTPKETRNRSSANRGRRPGLSLCRSPGSTLSRCRNRRPQRRTATPPARARSIGRTGVRRGQPSRRRRRPSCPCTKETRTGSKRGRVRLLGGCLSGTVDTRIPNNRCLLATRSRSSSPPPPSFPGRSRQARKTSRDARSTSLRPALLQPRSTQSPECSGYWRRPCTLVGVTVGPTTSTHPHKRRRARRRQEGGGLLGVFRALTASLSRLRKSVSVIKE